MDNGIQKAVTARERLEQLSAGFTANADAPALDSEVLQGYITELNDLEARINQAKLAQKAATKPAAKITAAGSKTTARRFRETPPGGLP